MSETADINYKLVGARIAQLRKDRGMTQRVLAEKADISEVYLSRLEHGKSKVSLQCILQIANGLNATVDQLLIGNRAAYNKALCVETEKLFEGCRTAERSIMLEILSAAKVALIKHRTDT